MADTVLRGRGLMLRLLRLLTVGGFVLLGGLATAACSSGADGPDESAVDSASVSFGGDDDPAEGGDASTTDAEGDTGSNGSDDASTSDSADEEVAAIEAEVERVIQRNWEIWIECTTAVDTCDPATALAETESTTSQFYQESVGVVELWKQQGIAYRPVEGLPTDRFVEIRSVEVAPDLASAEVLLCDRDDRARFERADGGEYEMVEGTDFVEDLLLRRVVAEEGGEWRIVENELLERRAVTEGIDPLC